MNTPKMTKAFYGKPDELANKLREKNIARMRDGGWFDPPLSPELIPKHFQVFNLKKASHQRHRVIYTMLLARSNALGGITKFPNKSIVIAAKQFFDMTLSCQQIVYSIAFLKRHKLIATLNSFKGAKALRNASPDQVETAKQSGYFKPKSDRMFLVWATFYANRCTPKRVGWTGLKSDPRVDCDEWKKARSKIPLQYKISKTFEKMFSDKFVTIRPANINWETLFNIGVLDSWMYHNILRFTEADSDGFGDVFIGIMGRSESRLFYLAHKVKIDTARAKRIAAKESYITEEKRKYGIQSEA